MSDSEYWPNGCRGAVSLTYDDAVPVHYEQVGPRLEERGLRATFYTNVMNLVRNVDAWREMAARGHELGNHSIFHPCRKDTPKDWLDDAYDLRHYTARRWLDEMRAANAYLTLVDGKTERTFGNTCCNTSIGQLGEEESIEPLVEELFPAARGPYNEVSIDPAAPNFNGLGHFGADQQSFDVLRGQIDAAVDAGHWIVYMIHGVGAETHSHHILPDEHARLVDYLAESKDRIWTAPMIEVVRHLRGGQK